MQKVNSCCCGCSLKTGTLILLILTLINALWTMVGSFKTPDNPTESTRIIMSLIVLCISIAGIYGATQEKPVFLIPYMVVLLLGLVGLIIIMLASVIFGVDYIALYILENPADEKQFEKLKERGSSNILKREVIGGICAALQYYFYIVVLSFFKTLRSGSQENGNEATYTI